LATTQAQSLYRVAPVCPAKNAKCQRAISPASRASVCDSYAAWFCAATLIARFRFLFFRFTGLLYFALLKAQNANERSAQLQLHRFAIPML
jgi:hypothetical protein